MRKLLLLVVIVVLLIAGDASLRAAAESRVAAQLQSSFDADGEANIDFGGFPFVARVLSGTIPVARLSSSSLTRAGVRLTDVKMTLEDVGFSWSKVLAGEVGSVTVRSGKGSASLTQRGLNRAISALIDHVRVRLADDSLRATVGGISGRGDLAIEDTDLVLSVQGTERTVSLPLPRFVAGLRYEAVDVRDGKLAIRFALDGASFDDF